MQLPRAVIVHGLEQARCALAPGLAVTLLSARGAALYAGVGWWRALVVTAAGDRPAPPDILDCGDAPGRALEALRHGQRLLILRAPGVLSPRAHEDVASRAASGGATVFDAAPAALDLADRGAERHLLAWLHGAHQMR